MTIAAIGPIGSPPRFLDAGLVRLPLPPAAVDSQELKTLLLVGAETGLASVKSRDRS